MHLIHQTLDILHHLDVYLDKGAASMGVWFFVVLFAVIFCETGLVVTPFLPGDSLLFLLGIMTVAADSHVNLVTVGVLLSIAAILGDSVNYWIGCKIGPKIFKSESSRLLNKKHLLRAHEFYETYGGKTIILARFVPIVRTFAPFVAGIGKMTYSHFAAFNVIGAIVWVFGFLFAGRMFGNVDFVKKHIELVSLAIVFISILPAIVEIMRGRAESKRKGFEAISTPQGTEISASKVG